MTDITQEDLEHTWDCAFVTRGGVCDCGVIEWPKGEQA